jgi:hypothetical protein
MPSRQLPLSVSQTKDARERRQKPVAVTIAGNDQKRRMRNGNNP